MPALKNIYALALSSLSITSVHAMDDGCIYEANKPSTALINYTCVLADGDGNCDSSGSGFIISEAGHVLTNHHVISPDPDLTDVKVESEKITIQVGDTYSTPLLATIIARDKSNDLALLKLPPHPNGEVWPAVAIGENTSLPVGAPLMGMGYSQSELSIIPDGKKTAETTKVDGEVKTWWQTSLALNHGNSGGPIFGSLGTVVGISVAYKKSSQLVSYIIPIHRADHFLEIANVTPVKSGSCASLPECRHISHGLERYTVDTVEDKWSDWKPSGYNRPAYCNDLLTELKVKYPDSQFTKITDDEESQNNFGTPRYKYYCKFRRLEKPVYNFARSEACLP